MDQVKLVQTAVEKVRRITVRVLALTVVGIAVCIALLYGGVASFHAAARDGDSAAAKKWLAVGFSPNLRHPRTLDTPLIEAARHGHLDMVKLLVEKGANVNLQGEAWYAPLHCAAAAGHIEVMKFLLDHGADLTLFSGNGHNTPLHEAAANGQTEAVALLLAQGAAIGAKGIDEATPLEVAAVNGHAAMVEFLLARGAEVNSRGLYGRTPLHAAADRDQVEVGRLLLAHGADPDLECNGRPVHGRSGAFRQLLQQHERAPK
ncbi:MAG: ankyrin repeat domain-containing protein [Candidatus Hydrogenedentes bacterium]|nr:ankyrin repeat domain-containing protein [Candidatus Hydrogenedentota bacterium]